MDSTITSLREVQENDIAIFFDHQQDADALHMAAFTPRAKPIGSAS